MLTYFGDPGTKLFADAFLAAASSESVELFEFYHVMDSECATQFAVTEPAVVAFKSFGGGRAIYDREPTEEALRLWYKPRQYPRHFVFTQEHNSLLVDEKIPALVLFFRIKDEDAPFVQAF